MMTPQQTLESLKNLRKTFDAMLSFYNELSDEAFHELYERMETLIKELQEDAITNSLTLQKL